MLLLLKFNPLLLLLKFYYWLLLLLLFEPLVLLLQLHPFLCWLSVLPHNLLDGEEVGELLQQREVRQGKQPRHADVAVPHLRLDHLLS